MCWFAAAKHNLCAKSPRCVYRRGGAAVALNCPLLPLKSNGRREFCSPDLTHLVPQRSAS